VGLTADADVLVCGASFAGLAVARELAGAGADVLVVDRYEIGARDLGLRGADAVAARHGRRERHPPRAAGDDVHDAARNGALPAALELVGSADVLLEGFRPGVTERLGLGPTECLKINPRLVYVAAYGYRAAGPALLTNVSYFEKRVCVWDPETLS